MEPVPIESIPIQQSYYMPHHPIVKECSLTTKVRVVFDASHKSSNDLSLNDNLMVGPKLQSDLIIILLRFRLHAVAVTADIEKMYRQVLVVKEHVDYQRIVWREKPSDPIQDYNLLTVTYGTASAPYHAIRCLHQLAYDEGKMFPEAAEVLMENFYVDDLILSVPSADQAIHLHQQLVEVLQSAGFHLRKWASNNNLVFDAINQELTSDDNKLRITPKESIKTLGLEWHPRVDQFRFTTASSQHSFAQTLTKRSMLSSIARIFDPLGLLSPATIRAKILLQSLWKLQLDWDDEVDPTTQRHWHDYIHDLKFLDEIHIDRCISLSGECHFELHVFSDASEKAYAAVVYLKSMDSSGCCMVSLVASKTKVAPLKPVSIPRLELCAALLASKLGRLIIESLKIKIEKTHAWTDSMVTLSWISFPASRWKSFVAHRVLQIQENMPEAIWKHVPGDENPADCASRGITVHHLASHELWWKGPAWLASNDWPNSLGSFNNEISQQEERTSSTKVLLTSITLDLSIIDQYSNLTKLVRVVALCFRFYKNTKLTTETRIHGFLSVIELNQALNTLIRLVQRVEFSEEIQSLNAGKPISTKS